MPELRARVLARRVAELCLARGVLPELRGAESISEVVIPLASRYAASEAITYLHGPVVIVCGYGERASEPRVLVDTACEASVYARGWAPIYVRLWQELLRG